MGGGVYIPVYLYQGNNVIPEALVFCLNVELELVVPGGEVVAVRLRAPEVSQLLLGNRSYKQKKRR